jgi:hypothetical protein
VLVNGGLLLLRAHTNGSPIISSTPSNASISTFAKEKGTPFAAARANGQRVRFVLLLSVFFFFFLQRERNSLRYNRCKHFFLATITLLDAIGTYPHPHPPFQMPAQHADPCI